jgi:hypothetical protein
MTRQTFIEEKPIPQKKNTQIKFKKIRYPGPRYPKQIQPALSKQQFDELFKSNKPKKYISDAVLEFFGNTFRPGSNVEVYIIDMLNFLSCFCRAYTENKIIEFTDEIITLSCESIKQFMNMLQSKGVDVYIIIVAKPLIKKVSGINDPICDTQRFFSIMTNFFRHYIDRNKVIILEARGEINRLTGKNESDDATACFLYLVLLSLGYYARLVSGDKFRSFKFYVNNNFNVFDVCARIEYPIFGKHDVSSLVDKLESTPFSFVTQPFSTSEPPLLIIA